MAQDIYLNPTAYSTGGLKDTTSALSLANPNLGGQMRKFTIPYTEIARTATASAGTNYIIVKKLPPSVVITFARIKHSALFVAASLTAMVVRPLIGTFTDASGVPTVSSVTALTAGTLDTLAAVGTTEGTNLRTDITGAANTFGATNTVLAVSVVPTGANTSALSAGSLDVWFDYIVIGQ